MAVYVDDGAIGFGRMLMCHMIADSREELDAMADKVGVQRKWIQKAGTAREHYDICQSKRKMAIKAGAVELSSKELVKLLRERQSTEGSKS